MKRVARTENKHMELLKKQCLLAACVAVASSTAWALPPPPKDAELTCRRIEVLTAQRLVANPLNDVSAKARDNASFCASSFDWSESDNRGTGQITQFVRENPPGPNEPIERPTFYPLNPKPDPFAKPDPFSADMHKRQIRQGVLSSENNYYKPVDGLPLALQPLSTADLFASSSAKNSKAWKNMNARCPDRHWDEGIPGLDFDVADLYDTTTNYKGLKVVDMVKPKERAAIIVGKTIAPLLATLRQSSEVNDSADPLLGLVFKNGRQFMRRVLGEAAGLPPSTDYRGLSDDKFYELVDSSFAKFFAGSGPAFAKLSLAEQSLLRPGQDTGLLNDADRRARTSAGLTNLIYHAYLETLKIDDEGKDVKYITSRVKTMADVKQEQNRMLGLRTQGPTRSYCESQYEEADKTAYAQIMHREGASAIKQMVDGLDQAQQAAIIQELHPKIDNKRHQDREEFETIKKITPDLEGQPREYRKLSTIFRMCYQAASRALAQMHAAPPAAPEGPQLFGTKGSGPETPLAGMAGLEKFDASDECKKQVEIEAQGHIDALKKQAASQPAKAAALQKEMAATEEGLKLFHDNFEKVKVFDPKSFIPTRQDSDASVAEAWFTTCAYQKLNAEFELSSITDFKAKLAEIRQACQRETKQKFMFVEHLVPYDIAFDETLENFIAARQAAINNDSYTSDPRYLHRGPTGEDGGANRFLDNFHKFAAYAANDPDAQKLFPGLEHFSEGKIRMLTAETYAEHRGYQDQIRRHSFEWINNCKLRYFRSPPTLGLDQTGVGHTLCPEFRHIGPVGSEMHDLSGLFDDYRAVEALGLVYDESSLLDEQAHQMSVHDMYRLKIFNDLKAEKGDPAKMIARLQGVKALFTEFKDVAAMLEYAGHLGELLESMAPDARKKTEERLLAIQTAALLQNPKAVDDLIGFAQSIEKPGTKLPPGVQGITGFFGKPMRLGNTLLIPRGPEYATPGDTKNYTTHPRVDFIDVEKAHNDIVDSLSKMKDYSTRIQKIGEENGSFENSQLSGFRSAAPTMGVVAGTGLAVLGLVSGVGTIPTLAYLLVGGGIALGVANHEGVGGVERTGNLGFIPLYERTKVLQNNKEAQHLQELYDGHKAQLQTNYGFQPDSDLRLELTLEQNEFVTKGPNEIQEMLVKVQKAVSDPKRGAFHPRYPNLSRANQYNYDIYVRDANELKATLALFGFTDKTPTDEILKVINPIIYAKREERIDLTRAAVAKANEERHKAHAPKYMEEHPLLGDYWMPINTGAIEDPYNSLAESNAAYYANIGAGVKQAAYEAGGAVLMEVGAVAALTTPKAVEVFVKNGLQYYRKTGSIRQATVFGAKTVGRGYKAIWAQRAARLTEKTIASADEMLLASNSARLGKNMFYLFPKLMGPVINTVGAGVSLAGQGAYAGLMRATGSSGEPPDWVKHLNIYSSFAGEEDSSYLNSNLQQLLFSTNPEGFALQYGMLAVGGGLGHFAKAGMKRIPGIRALDGDKFRFNFKKMPDGKTLLLDSTGKPVAKHFLGFFPTSVSLIDIPANGLGAGVAVLLQHLADKKLEEWHDRPPQNMEVVRQKFANQLETLKKKIQEKQEFLKTKKSEVGSKEGDELKAMQADVANLEQALALANTEEGELQKKVDRIDTNEFNRKLGLWAGNLAFLHASAEFIEGKLHHLGQEAVTNANIGELKRISESHPVTKKFESDPNTDLVVIPRKDRATNKEMLDDLSHTERRLRDEAQAEADDTGRASGYFWPYHVEYKPDGSVNVRYTSGIETWVPLTPRTGRGPTPASLAKVKPAVGEAAAPATTGAPTQETAISNFSRQFTTDNNALLGRILNTHEAARKLDSDHSINRIDIPHIEDASPEDVAFVQDLVKGERALKERAQMLAMATHKSSGYTWPYHIEFHQDGSVTVILSDPHYSFIPVLPR